MSRTIAIVVVVALTVGTLGCIRALPVPAQSSTTDYRVPRPREEVFDAAVAVGQRMNLDVPVLEKGSGFLRFEYANVSAEQLDRYCQFPYASTKSNVPTGTFSEWAEAGRVVGIIQLVLVMSADGPAATNLAVRSRCRVVAPGELRPRGYTNVFADECNSLGVLEKEFVGSIEARLGLR